MNVLKKCMFSYIMFASLICNGMEADDGWYYGLDEVSDEATGVDADLFKACRENDIHKMKSLIESNGSVNARNYGRTLLHLAASQDHSDSTRFLLESGLRPNIRNVDGNTPLHFAAQYGSIKNIKILIEHQACVNLKNKNFVTPLFNAINGINLSCINLLLDNGVPFSNFDIKCAKGEFEQKDLLLFKQRYIQQENILLLQSLGFLRFFIQPYACDVILPVD